MKAKEIINWVVYFVCLLAVVFVINTFVVQRTMVSVHCPAARNARSVP